MAPFSPELPLELLCEIIKLLPLSDLQTLSLASRLTRSQAIPFLFGHLRYSTGIPSKVRKIHQATKDVKEVIKKLELSSYTIRNDEDSLVICQFLETLPNLRALDVDDLFPFAYLSQFISSIRRTSLLELVFETVSYEPVEGPPTAGLAGLEKLSIIWSASDNPNEPGSSLAHLYELIRPSLTTLVELRINNESDIFCGDFDLQLLKPAANTLRSFGYTHSEDESILDTIPVILPHLTKLSIIWGPKMHPIWWKDVHIQALSKNKNLTDLTLSSNSVEVRVDVRTERNLKATQDLASACPRLQRCSWCLRRLSNRSCPVADSFIVEERMTGGNMTRVVINEH